MSEAVKQVEDEKTLNLSTHRLVGECDSEYLYLFIDPRDTIREMLEVILYQHLYTLYCSKVISGCDMAKFSFISFCDAYSVYLEALELDTDADYYLDDIHDSYMEILLNECDSSMGLENLQYDLMKRTFPKMSRFIIEAEEFEAVQSLVQNGKLLEWKETKFPEVMRKVVTGNAVARDILRSLLARLREEKIALKIKKGQSITYGYALTVAYSIFEFGIFCLLLYDMDLVSADKEFVIWLYGLIEDSMQYAEESEFGNDTLKYANFELVVLPRDEVLLSKVSSLCLNDSYKEESILYKDTYYLFRSWFQNKQACDNNMVMNITVFKDIADMLKSHGIEETFKEEVV